MEKIIRKAVRCFLIKDNKVMVIKYKEPNKKAGYYDIPGGKIEEGEKPIDTAIREMKEETKIDVRKLKYKGKIRVEYPNREYIFDTFVTNEYTGNPKETEENFAEWIEIDELLKTGKILSNLKVLEPQYIKGLIDDTYNFYMNIQVDEQENILNIDYKIEEIK